MNVSRIKEFQGFLADLRNLLIGLNSVTAEAATEEFLYTARSFIASPKLNAVSNTMLGILDRGIKMNILPPMFDR